MEAKILFVYPYNFIGEIIDMAEGDGLDPSHVAIVLENNLVEAETRGVIYSELNRYSHCTTRTIKVPVTNLEMGKSALAIIEGDRYSILGCIQAWIYKIFKVNIPLSGGSTKFCSDLAVRYLRCCGLDIFTGIAAKNIMPKDLLRELVKLERA